MAYCKNSDFKRVNFLSISLNKKGIVSDEVGGERVGAGGRWSVQMEHEEGLD
jgi:hypothetical protein